MPEIAVYAPGTPCYVDLSSPEPDKSKVFYTSLFGWEAQGGVGGYYLLTCKGKRVAGAGPAQEPGRPAAWATYVATENADETARKVKDAGGKVLARPFDVLTAGRMAVFRDPTGASFSVWQSRDFAGAELINEPGSLGWAELQTRDMATARTFYKNVFGWDARDNAMAGGGTYSEWLLNGESIGGGIQMGVNFPPNLPSNWLTYFAVADTDTTVKKTQELGGKVIVPPTTIARGRFSVLSDPQGGVFTVIADVISQG